MGALGRFLAATELPATVAAVVAGALTQGAVLVAGADAVSRAQRTPAAIELVRRHAVAEDGARAVAYLRASAERCIIGQERMLRRVSERAGIGAVDERAAEIAVERAAGRPRVAIREASAGAPGAAAADLVRHAALRESCLAWAARSVEDLRRSLGDEPSPDFSIARLHARLDADRLSALGMGAVGTDDLDGMATGPRP